MEWNEDLKWNGRNGMEWNGMEWNAAESRLEFDFSDRRMKQQSSGDRQRLVERATPGGIAAENDG